MICPQCGKRNELGVQRCRFCRYPFTRRAARARSAPRQTEPHTAGASGQRPSDSGYDPRPPEMRAPQPVPGAERKWATYPAYAPEPEPEAYYDPPPARGRTRQPSRRARGRHGCLLAFGLASLLAVGALVLLLLAATMVVQPMIRDAAVDDLRQGVRSEVSRQITTQIGEAPGGEIVLSQDELNRRLANSGSLGPISDVGVTITPEGLVVRLRAYGVDGTYQATVEEQAGSVVLSGSPMEGPLALLLPEGDLEEAINAELATALAESGYYVNDVAMRDGAIVLQMAQ